MESCQSFPTVANYTVNKWHDLTSTRLSLFVEMPYSNRYKPNRANDLSHVFNFTATSVHCKHCVKGGTQELQEVNGVLHVAFLVFDCQILFYNNRQNSRALIGS